MVVVVLFRTTMTASILDNTIYIDNFVYQSFNSQAFQDTIVNRQHKVDKI